MHPGAGSSAVKLQQRLRASDDTRSDAAAWAWHAGRAAPAGPHRTYTYMSRCTDSYCATDEPVLGEVVAAGAAEDSKSTVLCNTRCRRDGYGTIDLGEMASVQVMMVERECPGIKSSTWTKLKLSILCAALASPALTSIERALSH